MGFNQKEFDERYNEYLTRNATSSSNGGSGLSDFDKRYNDFLRRTSDATPKAKGVVVGIDKLATQIVPPQKFNEKDFNARYNDYIERTTPTTQAEPIQQVEPQLHATTTPQAIQNPTYSLKDKVDSENLVASNTKKKDTGILNAIGNFFKGGAKKIGKTGLELLEMAKPKELSMISYDPQRDAENSVKNNPFYLFKSKEEKAALVEKEKAYLEEGSNKYLANANEKERAYLEKEKERVLRNQGNIDKALDYLTVKDTDTTATQVGNTVADVITQIGQLSIAGGAASKLGVGANIGNTIVQKGVQGAATGAINSAMNSAREDEDLGDSLKNATRGALFFGAGGVAGEAAGLGIQSALVSRGLQNNIPAYIAEQAGIGAAFSVAGNVATLPTYPLMGDEMPGAKDIALDTAVGVIYDIVPAMLKIRGITKESKAMITEATSNLKKSYEVAAALEMQGTGNTQSLNTLYDSMLMQLAKAKYALNNTRLLGQEQWVKEINAVLDNTQRSVITKQQAINTKATIGQGGTSTMQPGASMPPSAMSQGSQLPGVAPRTRPTTYKQVEGAKRNATINEIIAPQETQAQPVSVNEPQVIDSATQKENVAEVNLEQSMAISNNNQKEEGLTQPEPLTTPKTELTINQPVNNEVTPVTKANEVEMPQEATMTTTKAPLQVGEAVSFMLDGKEQQGVFKALDKEYGEFEVVTQDGKKYYLAEHEVYRAGEIPQATNDTITLQDRADNILATKGAEIESTKVAIERNKEAVGYLRSMKEGKKSAAIYLSPELAGVDNLKELRGYLKFTSDAKAQKLDVVQMEMSKDFPEVKEMHMEQFGEWLVDNVGKYREGVKDISQKELDYKETYKMLSVKAKDMQNVKAFESAIEEIEKSMSRIPLDLQFFARQKLKQYKSLVRQLKKEGVTSETIERVQKLQRELKSSEKRIERLKANEDSKFERMLELAKDDKAVLKEKFEREKKLALSKSEFKAAVEKDNIENTYKNKLENVTDKAEGDKILLKEKLEREKRTAVSKVAFKAAIEKDNLHNKVVAARARGEKRLAEEKAKRHIDKFKNMTKENRADIKKKLKELKKIDIKKLEPETKKSVQTLINFIQSTDVSPKSKYDVDSLFKALDKLEILEEDGQVEAGFAKQFRERIASIKDLSPGMNYDDFVDIYKTIKYLEHQNKMKNKIMIKNKLSDMHESRKWFEADVDKKLGISKRAAKGKVARGIKVGSRGEVTYRKKILEKVDLYTLQVKNLVQLLEGTQGGVATELLYKNFVKGNTHYYKEQYKLSQYIKEKGKDIDFKALQDGEYEVLTHSGMTKITTLEKVAIALNSFNEKNRYSLINGGFARENNTDIIFKLDEEQIDKLVVDLTPNEDKVVNMILGAFETLNKPSLNTYSMGEWNFEIATEPFYYPKNTVRKAQMEGATEATQLQHVRGGNLENAGILKSKNYTNTPLLLSNPLKVLIRTMDESATLTAYGRAIKDATWFLKREETFIKTNYSVAMYDELKNFVDSYTAPRADHNILDQAMNKLYNNSVTAVFALNIGTSLKQPLGLVSALTEIETKYVTKALPKVFKMTQKDKDIIHEYAPVLWFRGQGHIDKDMSEETLDTNMKRMIYGKKTLRELGTFHITYTDMKVCYALWYGAEAKIQDTMPSLKVGSTEYYEAVGELATEIVLTTQSSGEATHRSHLMRGDNVWKKFFTAFQGQMQIAYNQLRSSFEKFKETGNGFALTKEILLAILIPAIGDTTVTALMQAIQKNDNSLYVKYKEALATGIGQDEVLKDFTAEVVGNIVNLNLFAGVVYDSIQSANTFYDNDNNPANRNMANLYKGLNFLLQANSVDSEAVYTSGDNKGLKKKDVLYGKAFDKLSDSLLNLTGVPVGNAKKLVKMADGIKNGYGYEVTEAEALSTYVKSVNAIEKAAKENQVELPIDQAEVINELQRLNNAIKRDEKALKEAIAEEDEVGISYLEETIAASIAAAKAYYEENEDLINQ